MPVATRVSLRLPVRDTVPSSVFLVVQLLCCVLELVLAPARMPAAVRLRLSKRPLQATFATMHSR